MRHLEADHLIAHNLRETREDCVFAYDEAENRLLAERAVLLTISGFAWKDMYQ
jgi:hypothetical protein